MDIKNVSDIGKRRFSDFNVSCGDFISGAILNIRRHVRGNVNSFRNIRGGVDSVQVGGSGRGVYKSTDNDRVGCGIATRACEGAQGECGGGRGEAHEISSGNGGGRCGDCG